MKNKVTYGFYGGKFFPMHKGHLYCIETMSKMCDKGTVIIFINGKDECDYFKNHNSQRDLLINKRILQLEKACKNFPNINYKIIDCINCRKKDGSEDWDAETPLVRHYLPHIDYVFSSEIEYDDYFKRAYPEAKHIIVDSKREKVSISATELRNMDEKERKVWMV